MADKIMIEADGLVKRYGDTLALDHVGISVPQGTVLGMLGPNGAGKTTTVRVLTTLLVPDEGTARVAGFDVVAEAGPARRHIGVTGQNATLDELLTGRQNLVMMGELSRLSRAGAKAGADDLLERFDLTGAADRVVKGYSGGMRRRLDLAASLMARPPVLFLDEPTTGLDPTSRLGMWEIVRGLVADGVTVLLTTQYLDEADELADRIVVVDHGRVIAEGTPRELKDAVGGERLQLTLAEADEAVAAIVAPFVVGDVFVTDEGRRVVANVDPSPGLVTRLIRALDDAGIPVDEVEMHRPSLDDVFFTLTGRDPAHADSGESPDSSTDPDESAAA